MSRKEDALKRLACVLGCVEKEDDVNGNTVDEILECIAEHIKSGEDALEEAKKYTDEKTKFAWTNNEKDSNSVFVNLAGYVALQNALASPGGRVTLTADAESDFENRLSRVHQTLNDRPCQIGVAITAAGDVTGNRAFIHLVPQVETLAKIVTNFVEYNGDILIVYMEFLPTQLTYVVQKLNATPLVPAT